MKKLWTLTLVLLLSAPVVAEQKQDHTKDQKQVVQQDPNAGRPTDNNAQLQAALAELQSKCSLREKRKN